MDRLIYTAMTGAQEALHEQSVISNNLANATTSGFRAQLHALRAVPVQGEGFLPTRVAVAATVPGSDFSSGALQSTGRELDVALHGNAWLAVQDSSGAEAYTRRGDLQLDGNGLLLSGGRPVLGDGGPIVLPLAAEVFIGRDGTLSAIAEGQEPDALVEVGRLKLVDPGAQTFERGEDGLFRLPLGPEGLRPVLERGEELTLSSGALEGSNVSVIEAMVGMINNARRYEMQMKLIGSAEENARQGDKLLSLQG